MDGQWLKLMVSQMPAPAPALTERLMHGHPVARGTSERFAAVIPAPDLTE